MSEYQYYEFQAVDRPLTAKQMGKLRRISTRAEISPHRFTNVYNFGDFKGDPVKLMARYYDAFLYLADWGTPSAAPRRRAVELLERSAVLAELRKKKEAAKRKREQAPRR